MYQLFSKIIRCLISRQITSPVNRITIQQSYLAMLPKTILINTFNSLIGLPFAWKVVDLTLSDTLGLWTRVDVDPDDVFIIFRRFFPQTVPTYLPNYLPTCLPACLPACLPTYLSSYLSACLIILPAYLQTNLLAQLPAYLSVCLPAPLGSSCITNPSF